MQTGKAVLIHWEVKPPEPANRTLVSVRKF